MSARILPVVLRTLSTLEILWFFLLPWLAYWIVLRAHEETPTSTALLGWSVVIVYQIIKIGMVLNSQGSTRRPLVRLLAILAPTAVIAIAQFLRSGNITSYLLELATLEFIVLVIAFPTALSFVKNDKGRSAWQDIGALPLLLGVLFYFGVNAFISTWWKSAPSWDQHPIPFLLLIGALLIEFTYALSNLNRFAKRQVQLPDISSNPKVLVILLAQIPLWWLLPVAANLLTK